MIGIARQRCLQVTWDGKELYGGFSSPIAESARENGCAAGRRIGNSRDDYEVLCPSIRHLRIEIPLRPIGLLPVPDEPESARAVKRESGKTEVTVVQLRPFVGVDGEYQYGPALSPLT